MVSIEAPALKPQARPNIVVEKALQLLDTHAVKTSGGIISFKECRKVWGWLYHLDKGETDRFLFELKEMGLVEFISCHGIKLLKTRWEWF